MDAPGLPAPEILEAIDGKVDVSDISGDYIHVRLPFYIGIHHGDVIQYYFDETLASKQVIPVTGPFPSAIEAPISKYRFRDGIYTVTCRAIDIAGNTGYSESTDIEIINSEAYKIQAPFFPDAVSGKLSRNSILQHDGAFVRASYTGLTVDDSIQFYWGGVDSHGTPAPFASFESTPIQVQQINVISGYVETKIPASNMLAVGNNGMGTAYYTIVPSPTNPYYDDTMQSPKVRITISFQQVIDKLRSIATKFAGSRDSKYPHLKPSNSVKIYGAADMDLKASVYPNATIDGTPSAGIPMDFSLDDIGVKVIRVYTSSATSEKADTTLTVSPRTPGEALPTPLHFNPYRSGQAGIAFYSYSTNAPSDGSTPCAIYLGLNSAYKSVDVSVDGATGLINGWATATTVPVHSDGTATIHIVSTSEGSVFVKLAATGVSGGDNLNVELTFAGE